MPLREPKEPLGILAGGGELPRSIIRNCQDTGRKFFVIAFDGLTPEETVAPSGGTAVPHAWVRLGAAGAAIDLLRGAGARDLVLAGPIRRPSIAALMPDAWAAKLFAKAGLTALGDDGLLSAIVKALEEEGFKVVGPDSLLPELLAPEGVYGKIKPDREALADIQRGLHVALGAGALDVGQAAVVQQGIVLAVEAAEGTDEMIARAGQNRRHDAPGGVLVKVSKPNQERRADLPAIGAATVKAAAAAGLRGIAVEAGRSLIINREEAIKAADESGLFVIGVRAPVKD